MRYLSCELEFMLKNTIWIFTIGVICLLTLPLLIQDGMFFDGMLYTCVSHNLANGLGSFWAPHFSETWVQFGQPLPFREHPPLVFGIQSLFFKALGSSMYVERFYVFCCLLIQAMLIVLIWRRILPASMSSKGRGWLPLLTWFTIPLVFWSFTHNIHENTMGIFTLLAAYFSLLALKEERIKFLYFLISGLFIVAASLSKGVPGFFPLAIPFLYALVFKQWKKFFWGTSITLGTVVLFFVLLVQHPPAWEALSFYVKDRLLHRIAQNPTVDYHLAIVWRAFTELIPGLILTGILLWWGGKKWPSRSHLRWAALFGLIGLAGVAPLAITKVQRGFYMDPALPFLALALATMSLPAIIRIGEKLRGKNSLQKVFAGFSWLLLIVALGLTLSQIGKVKKHQGILHDTHIIGEILPEGTIISLDPSLGTTFSIHTYLVRHYYISSETGSELEYRLFKKGQKLGRLQGSYVPVPGDFQVVQLYKKVK